MKRLGTFVCAMCILWQVHTQIVTSGALTPTQLVNDVLLGGGVTASNITYTGYANGIAHFTSTASVNLGFDEGVYLTSGSYLQNDPLGFNGTDGPMGPWSNFQSVPAMTPGDPDLDLMVQVLTGDPAMFTNDAAVLEFDFIPQSDTITFRYRFASEEYNEYVPNSMGSGIADVFAFFLTGVTTPLAQTNIAILPASNTPVSIFTVNNGNSAGNAAGPCTNCAFFVDNVNNAGGIDVVYDGLTVVLTASFPVVCGQKYHIKIAIADASDSALDSGVFLEAGSFTSVPGVQVVTGVNPFTQDTLVTENCGATELLFIRPGSTVTEDTVFYNLSGTALSGVDYTGLNGSVIFPVGVDTVSVWVSGLSDPLAEGQETIVLNFDAGGCGGNALSHTLYMQDYNLPHISLGNDTIFDCMDLHDGFILQPHVTGGIQPLQFLWNTGSISPSLFIFNAGSYWVSATDVCMHTATDTIRIDIVPPASIHLQVTEDTTVCPGTVLNLQAIATGGNGNLQYQWSNGWGSPTQMVVVEEPMNIGIQVSDVCGVSASDTVHLSTYPVVADFSYTNNLNEGDVWFYNESFPADADVQWRIDGWETQEANPHYVFNEPGYYHVILYATNSQGCVDSTERGIYIRMEYVIYIPNAFTPGNDPLNDEFIIKGNGFTQGTLRIYNRWGTEIYMYSGEEPAWNGRSKEKEVMPPGTYAYRFDYTDYAGISKTLYGHVQLLR